jgi:hypothetical protein
VLADFDIGVVVPTHTRVSKVVFTLTCGSGTYNGVSPYTFADVTSETWNARTQSWEFKVTVDVSAFSADNEFYVSAVVHDTNGATADKNTDGGACGMDDIYLVHNVGGTYQKATAWVDNVSGVDAQTPLDDGVNDEAKPYETIHGAIKALEKWMLDETGTARADLCTVRLAPSQTHQWDRADTNVVTTSYGWLTVTCESGQDYTTTTIGTSTSGLCTAMQHIKIENVKIGPNVNCLAFASGTLTDFWLWLHNSKVQSDDMHDTNDYPRAAIGPLKAPTRIWATDTIFDECRFPFPMNGEGPSTGAGPNFVRGCTFTNIGHDAVLNTIFVLNTTFDTVEPGVTGWHADNLQLESTEAWRNVLWKNISMTNVGYQGLIAQTNTNLFHRFAIANMYIADLPDGAERRSFVILRDLVFGLQLYNLTCDFRDPTPPSGRVTSGRVAFGTKTGDETRDAQYAEMDVQGCHFSALNYNASGGFLCIIEDGVDTPYAHNNFYNYEDAAARGETPGTDVTTTVPSWDSNGRPHAAPPLAGRMTPVTTEDLDSRIRGDKTAIGAYEALGIGLGELKRLARIHEVPPEF